MTMEKASSIVLVGHTVSFPATRSYSSVTSPVANFRAAGVSPAKGHKLFPLRERILSLALFGTGRELTN